MVHSVCNEDPLKELDSLWQIRSAGHNSSLVDYSLKFEFHSPLYQVASSLIINYLGVQMWNLFDSEAVNRQTILDKL